jgi:hypothetical protein
MSKTMSVLSLCLLLLISMSAIPAGAADAAAAAAADDATDDAADDCPDPKVKVAETTGCTMADAQTAFSTKADAACAGKCAEGCKYFGHTNPSCQTVSSPDCENRLGFWCPEQEITCICIKA